MSDTHLIRLADTELIALDGQCRPDTQAKVDAAKRRLAAIDFRADLDPRHAMFLAELATEAAEHGEVIWQGARIRSCDLCDTKPYGHFPFKSGPRRGQPNLDRPRVYPAVEMASRFVRVENHITLGGCTDCMTALKPEIVAVLADIRCEVPTALAVEGRVGWRKCDNRQCAKCGWMGHEGQLGRERTMLGDGTYPAYCPQCGAGGAFTRDIRTADGFVVTTPVETEWARRHDKYAHWPVVAR